MLSSRFHVRSAIQRLKLSLIEYLWPDERYKYRLGQNLFKIPIYYNQKLWLLFYLAYSKIELFGSSKLQHFKILNQWNEQENDFFIQIILSYPIVNRCTFKKNVYGFHLFSNKYSQRFSVVLVTVLVSLRAMFLSAPRLGPTGTRADRPDSSAGQQASWKHGPRYHGGRWGISLAILCLCNSNHGHAST